MGSSPNTAPNVGFVAREQVRHLRVHGGAETPRWGHWGQAPSRTPTEGGPGDKPWMVALSTSECDGIWRQALRGVFG